MRSIGADLSISKQGWAIDRNALRAAIPVPAVEAGNPYTPYATCRDEKTKKANAARISAVLR